MTWANAFSYLIVQLFVIVCDDSFVMHFIRIWSSGRAFLGSAAL